MFQLIILRGKDQLWSFPDIQVLSPTLPDNSLILLEKPSNNYIAPFLKMKDGGSPEFIGLERYGLVKKL